MSQEIPVITIDGPSGSGKGTISQLLAQKLKWFFLDSGIIYRVLAFAVEQRGIDSNNEEVITDIAEKLDVEFKTATDSTPEVHLGGADVTAIIRSEDYGKLASIIATLPKVRAALLDRQRAFRQKPGLVADGRDMGSVVFPTAQLKIFLIATLEERARRRYNQLKERGINVSLEQILNELVARDFRDKSRSVAPMKPASDAIIIDTTGLTINEVLLRILAEKKKREIG